MEEQRVVAVAFTTTTRGGSGTPSGSVTFKDGSATLEANGNPANVATFSTGSLAVGGHSITATYSGDANFQASTVRGLTQTVQYRIKVLSTASLSFTLQLENVNYVNLSASTLTVTTECVVAFSATTPTTCSPNPIQTIKSGTFAFNRNWQGMGPT